MYNTSYPKNLEELAQLISKQNPLLFVSSQTSTVLPYAQLKEKLDSAPLDIINLCRMPAEMELQENGDLKVQGPVTWQDAQSFCKAKGRSLMAWPTEVSASCLAGIATSATGEKSFGNGSLSKNLSSLAYMDWQGNIQYLYADRPFPQVGTKGLLESYQREFLPYQNFKNGPFPRMEKEIDLMVGTEGQLGAVVEACFKTQKLVPHTYIFLRLPRWEDDFSLHLEIVNKVQAFRKDIQGCEFLDENCLRFLDRDERPFLTGDMVTLEIKRDSFDHVYSELLCKIQLSADDIFEIDESKFLRLRLMVPQKIFEENSRKGITKKGTDIQVRESFFPELLKKYREAAMLGIQYGLFGHIGDCHLHFNFMPHKSEETQVDNFLKDLYQQAMKWQASPFAEHGLGLLKLPFIRPYHGQVVRSMFQELKKKHDPQNIFFPYGFMSLK